MESNQTETGKFDYLLEFYQQENFSGSVRINQIKTMATDQAGLKKCKVVVRD